MIGCGLAPFAARASRSGIRTAPGWWHPFHLPPAWARRRPSPCDLSKARGERRRGGLWRRGWPEREGSTRRMPEELWPRSPARSRPVHDDPVAGAAVLDHGLHGDSLIAEKVRCGEKPLSSIGTNRAVSEFGRLRACGCPPCVRLSLASSSLGPGREGTSIKGCCPSMSCVSIR
jgi:hypothetical protein